MCQLDISNLNFVAIKPLFCHSSKNTHFFLKSFFLKKKEKKIGVFLKEWQKNGLIVKKNGSLMYSSVTLRLFWNGCYLLVLLVYLTQYFITTPASSWITRTTKHNRTQQLPKQLQTFNRTSNQHANYKLPPFNLNLHV